MILAIPLDLQHAVEMDTAPDIDRRLTGDRNDAGAGEGEVTYGMRGWYEGGGEGGEGEDLQV